jgi:hypothetical protein
MGDSTAKSKKGILNLFGRRQKPETLEPGQKKKAKTFANDDSHALKPPKVGTFRPGRLTSAKTSWVAPPSSSSIPPGPSDPSVAIKSLQVEIEAILRENTIGYYGPKNYLPDQYYTKLINPTKVAKALPDASSELTEFVLKRAQKVFAITLLVFSGPEELHLAMKAFLSHEFTDTDGLPVNQITNLGQCNMFDESKHSGSECVPACYSPESNDCPHNWRTGVFHHEFWDIPAFNKFHTNQWSFLVQRFTGNEFQSSLKPERILPFPPRQESQQVSFGKFGKVTRTTMLKDHQDIFKPQVIQPLIQIEGMR